MSREIIGIDFGSTFSGVTHMPIGSENPPEFFILGSNSEKMVPTIVFFDENNVPIGWGAEIRNNRLFLEYPKGRIDCNFKQKLEPDNPESSRSCEFFLEKLYKRIKSAVNEPLTNANYATVIAHPAGWPSDRIDLLVDLCRRAGFPDVRPIEEPIAAMHNLRMQNTSTQELYGDHGENFMIIDFGGGTLDICVVKTDIRGRNPIPLATSGKTDLGGAEFNDLIEMLFKKEHDDVFWDTLNSEGKYNFKASIEDAKKSYSEHFSDDRIDENQQFRHRVDLPNGVESKVMELSKSQFRDNAKIYIDKITSTIHEALQKSGINPSEIKKVILTGGSSQWFFIKEIISKIFELNVDKIFHSENPLKDVVSGASISLAYEPGAHKKPGIRIKVSLDGKQNSHLMNILPEGRPQPMTNPTRRDMGTIQGSSLFKKRTIEIEWFSYSSSMGEKSLGKTSKRFKLNSNHPCFHRLKKATKYLLNGNGINDQSDLYHVSLEYKENDMGFLCKLLIRDENAVAYDASEGKGNSAKGHTISIEISPLNIESDIFH